MKRLLIVAACLLSLQIVKARSLPLIDSPLRSNHGSFQVNTTRDTNFVIPLNSYSASIFKLRLDSIRNEVPLDYNDYVQNYIDIYTRHKEEMSHVLGLAKYYFPIYEKIFHSSGINYLF